MSKDIDTLHNFVTIRNKPTVSTYLHVRPTIKNEKFLLLHFIRTCKYLVEEDMQRLPTKLCRKIVRAPCNVFINHRGIDTKRTIGRLLYDQLANMGVRPFLDNMNMIPGDRLFDHINKAILGCKVGVAIFSPRYCDSNFCLHELALLRETRKRVIPIFYDVKPSQLRVKDNGTCSYEELQRFSLALEEAKYTVGLTFDSSTGDWFKLLRNVTDAIVVNLLEVEEEQPH